MALIKVSEIEMAPDYYWNTYEAPAGDITLRPDSTIIDTLPCLQGVLCGEVALEAVLGDKYYDQNVESAVYKLDEGEGAYALKVFEGTPDWTPNMEDLVQMTRYGGVCIERALQGSLIDEVPLGTPRYEAMLSGDISKTLIMTWEEGEELAVLCADKNFDWNTAVKLKRKLASEVSRRLQEIGVIGDTSYGVMDIKNGRNVLVQTADEDERKITDIKLIDVFDTRSWPSKPRLWLREREAV